MNYVLLQQAESDLQRIYNYYFGLGPSLAARLEQEVRSLCARVGEFPEMYPRFYRHVRRAVLRRFHLGLFYVTTPGRTLIHGFQDLRQAPAYILRHIKDSLP
jgi:plasmid stabilization system protein ParE